MSLQILDRLASSHEALIVALDANDLAGIEQATTALAEAVEAARGIDAAAQGAGFKSRLSSLAVLAQAAQMRVNFLTDSVRRRVDTLAVAAGRPPAMTYRPGVR